MLQLLCRGEDGALFTGEFHLPYSQIMDAGEDSEEGMCSMDLLFTDVKCTPVEEDRRSFQVELAVQAQAVLRREVTVPILTDLYSTAYEVQPEEVTCPVLHLLGQGEEQESVREVVGTQGLPGNLLDVQARLDRIMITGPTGLVLYDTEEGLASARQKVVVQHRLSGQSGGKAVFSTELLREPTAAPAGEGVEVSFPLAFRWMVLEKEEAPVIGRVTLGEKRELGARQPSVILRAVHPGEDLWTVAKAYLTTDSDIMEASGLTSGEIFPGQMLLIPRKSS